MDLNLDEVEYSCDGPWLQSILNGPKKSIRLGALFHEMCYVICNGLQSICNGPKKSTFGSFVTFER